MLMITPPGLTLIKRSKPALSLPEALSMDQIP